MASFTIGRAVADDGSPVMRMVAVRTTIRDVLSSSAIRSALRVGRGADDGS